MRAVGLFGVVLLASCASASAPLGSETTETATVGSPPQGDGAEGAGADEEATAPVAQSHPALGETWTLQPADRVCVRGGQLQLTRSCTCGETHACDVVLAGTGIDVRLALDSASPATCDDCHPTSTLCALPAALSCSGSLAVTVNGAPAIEIPTGASCALAEGACWDVAPAPG